MNNDELDMNLEEMELNLDSLAIIDEPVIEELKSNDIIDSSDELTLGLSKDEIIEFYDYLAGKKPRPQFAERFFADSESRIKESNQITTLMGLSFIPKMLAVQQSLVDNLSSPETLKFLSIDERLSYLQTFAAISTKFNQIALDYSKAQKDLTSTPLVYRQLLDQLMLIPNDKMSRLKSIPKLVELNEDTWNRIIEIANL